MPVRDLIPNKRFNLYPESPIIQVIYHSTKAKLKPQEILDKFNMLVDESTILHDFILEKERMLIIKHGKQHYSISVAGDHIQSYARVVPFLSTQYDVVLESFNNYINLSQTKGKVA
jgi:hypothetical protein